MGFCDFHTHTVFSDGKNTPEEMVTAAIDRDMDAIGFSDHSPVAFDPEPNMQPERIAEYRRTIAALKQTYAERIRVLCGIEQDYYTQIPAIGYDYVIGSVHYVKAGDGFLSVDDTPEILREGIERYFGGDVYALTDVYWETVGNVVQETGADIIGHLDLIRKFNRNGEFFDETDPRYVSAAKQAIDALLKTGKPFEINTGAISRGWQDAPYPAPALMEYIREKGGRFILSSDSHRRETLCFRFDRWRHWNSASI